MFLKCEPEAKIRTIYHFARKSYIASCQITSIFYFPILLFNLACWVTKLKVQNFKTKTIKFYLIVVCLFQINIGTT